MARIVGIDLGTTNSLVAYMDHGTPRVISARHERAMVPSVVALTDNGLIVGDPAKEHLTRNPTSKTNWPTFPTRSQKKVASSGSSWERNPTPHPRSLP